MISVRIELEATDDEAVLTALSQVVQRLEAGATSFDDTRPNHSDPGNVETAGMALGGYVVTMRAHKERD